MNPTKAILTVVSLVCTLCSCAESRESDSGVCSESAAKGESGDCAADASRYLDAKIMDATDGHIADSAADASKYLDAKIVDATDQHIADSAAADGEQSDVEAQYPACSDEQYSLRPPPLAACVRYLATTGSMSDFISGYGLEVHLAVIGPRSSDTESCMRGLTTGYQVPGRGAGERWEPGIGWELEDQEGNPWLLELLFSPRPAQSLLESGEKVVIKADAGMASDANNTTGKIIVTREDGTLLAAATERWVLDEPGSKPTIDIEPAYTECADEIYCGIPSFAAIRVTAEGESATLKTRQSADLAGLKVFNGYYRQDLQGSCLMQPALGMLFGAYRLP